MRPGNPWVGRLICLGLLASGALWGQLSPGPLSSAHSELEGSDRCLSCHSQKKRIAASKCLDCHELLRERIDQGQGYHATLTDQGCERCHMEHHGVEFELVYWGESGRDAFDHGLTGFQLRGAHAQQACRNCHKAALVQEPQRLERRGKALDRTFLGLDGSTCLGCHVDEHRGQFESRSCDTCHGQTKWNEDLRFEHETSRFPLVGKHREVACNRCHRAAPAEDGASMVRFAGLAFQSCTDCHRDPHAGRLGSSCTQCHSENGWNLAGSRPFDHERTRFSLRGAHREVRCQACHPAGITAPVGEFGRCTDCHEDHHRGQFAGRPQGIECADCHTVESFLPPTFGLEAHQQSDYPLAGAHLAVACNACHLPLAEQQLPGIRGAAGSRAVQHSVSELINRYTFPSTLCSDCHGRPHEESLDRFMVEEDCQTCHDLGGWRSIEFDHERTDHSLAGAHQKVACIGCHRTEEELGDPAKRLRFKGLSEDCSVCHRDPHAAQFEDDGGATRCGRCHNPVDWRRTSFDHNQDSAFPLDGLHARVPCEGCHPAETRGEGQVVRYKPLGGTCRDCHSGSGPAEGAPG